MATPTCAGKSLAVAGVTDPLNYVLKKMMAANGLSERDFDMLPVGSTNDRLIAVQKGAVSATLLSQPDDFNAEGLGLTRLGAVHGLRRLAAVHRDERATRLGASEQRRAGSVPAGVRETPRAGSTITANRAEAIRLYVEQTRADPELTARTYDLYVASGRVLSHAGEVNMEGLRVLAENWQEFGLPDRRRQPSVGST